jgi:hypothetical protein
MKTRCFVVLLTVGLTGCTAQPLDREEARSRLLESTEWAREALLQGDWQRLANLSHPQFLEELGGREKYLQHLARYFTEMQRDQYRLADLHFSEPSELTEKEGEVYAVVPYRLVMIGPEGSEGIQDVYWIGVSEDRGHTWRFLAGAGLLSDRDLLKRFLPRFPDDLLLPPPQPPQWRKG